MSGEGRTLAEAPRVQLSLSALSVIINETAMGKGMFGMGGLDVYELDSLLRSTSPSQFP